MCTIFEINLILSKFKPLWPTLTRQSVGSTISLATSSRTWSIRNLQPYYWRLQTQNLTRKKPTTNMKKCQTLSSGRKFGTACFFVWISAVLHPCSPWRLLQRPYCHIDQLAAWQRPWSFVRRLAIVDILGSLTNGP